MQVCSKKKSTVIGGNLAQYNCHNITDLRVKIKCKKSAGFFLVSTWFERFIYMNINKEILETEA